MREYDDGDRGGEVSELTQTGLTRLAPVRPAPSRDDSLVSEPAGRRYQAVGGEQSQLTELTELSVRHNGTTNNAEQGKS